MSVRTHTLKEIGSQIARRRWLILVPFALGVALAPILAQYAPERYRSEALIVVIPQQVPDSYVKPTSQETVADRLPSITAQILSRAKLQLIIEEMDLYKAERSRWVMEDVVVRMRDDVTTIPSGRDADSFRVAYVSNNAEKARKVTERLAGLYIDQNSKDRATKADATHDFFEEQLTVARDRLVEQEQKLESYKKANAGQLPSQLQGNLQAIQNANVQLQALNESANRAQERRFLIERQIADIPLVAAPSGSPQALPPVPPGSGPDPPAGSTAQQLAQARARLAFLLQRFTPSYPEVVSLERTISELVLRLETEIPVSGAPAAPERPITAAEGAQQKKIRDLQADLAIIDFQLAATRAEADGLKKTITEYQAKVDALPTRESELVELTRDSSTMLLAYSSLLMKREDAVIAANLERDNIGEQFRLVDEASRPERPDNQRQRLTVMGSGAGAGLALGLVIFGLLELRDSSFKQAEEVLKKLSLPVLASIPVMVSEPERRAAKRRGWIMDLGGTALLVAAGTVLALWRLGSLG